MIKSDTRIHATSFSLSQSRAASSMVLLLERRNCSSARREGNFDAPIPRATLGRVVVSDGVSFAQTLHDDAHSPRVTRPQAVYGGHELALHLKRALTSQVEVISVGAGAVRVSNEPHGVNRARASRGPDNGTGGCLDNRVVVRLNAGPIELEPVKDAERP